MNAEFITIVQKLIAEQGKDTLVNPARCKAFLADYTKSEFSKERRLLVKVVETGAAKEIAAAENIETGKKIQVRHLQEELFMSEDIAADVVDMLAFVLRGDTAKTPYNMVSGEQETVISESTTSPPSVVETAPKKNGERSWDFNSMFNFIGFLVVLFFIAFVLGMGIATPFSPYPVDSDAGAIFILIGGAVVGTIFVIVGIIIGKKMNLFRN
jgi:hypothetical protein